MSENNWYVAESFKDLEKVGDIFEKNGKEYINVVLKSGKIHAARVYRTAERKTATTRTNHIIYDEYDALGFRPKAFVYLVRTDNEEKLQGICRWHPILGAYLSCCDDIFELPPGCDVKMLEWADVCDRTFSHLAPKEEILPFINSLFNK